jgi:glycosyltransferase involved in cell wall biosynthesis
MRVRDSSNLSFICFGGTDWWYHHRAHIDKQLLSRFAQLGPAMYINSIVMQKPGIRQGKIFLSKLDRKMKSIFKGAKLTDKGFWVYSPFSLPIHHIAWARVPHEILLRFQISLVAYLLRIKTPIVIVACPAACDTAIKLAKDKLVYNRTDVYEEFPNVDRETIKKYDRKLKSNADLTIFVNKKLFTEESYQCKNPLFLDHGVDFKMFSSADQGGIVPTEMAGIKRPIIGYFGEINGHTVDIEFTEKLVELLPEMSFVFVGNISSDYGSLKAKKNVWMLGKKPYKQIPHYGKCFDVAIMIWRQTRWIQVCNPIKLKEYLALGKPIVSTPFTELQYYHDIVYVAKSPEEFADCIKRALVEDNAERITERRQKVQYATWDNKAQSVLDALFGNKKIVLPVGIDE